MMIVMRPTEHETRLGLEVEPCPAPDEATGDGPRVLT